MVALRCGAAAAALCVLVAAAVVTAAAAGGKGQGQGEDQCSWCEGGACVSGCADIVEDVFPLSVSEALGGRGYPYWRAKSAQALGQALPQPQPHVRTAVVVQHGAGRNGDDYFCAMLQAMNLAGQRHDTLVLGMQFYQTDDDGLDEERYIFWDPNNGDDGFDDETDPMQDWKWGGNSTVSLPASIASFQVLDEMMAALADKTVYPKLERIVLAGHSAGGQFTQRYALFNRFDDVEDGEVPSLSYYVANPSSSTYLNTERPVLEPKTCAFCDNTTISAQTWEFATPENLDCQDTYNQYGYGLEGDVPPYVSDTGMDRALAQYRTRDVVYLSGSSDVCDTEYMTEENCVDCEPDDGGLDSSCEAEVAGYCRMARQHAFAQHVRRFYDGDVAHQLVEVPGVGHSGCAMFQSDAFLNSVFGTSRGDSMSSENEDSRDYDFYCFPVDAACAKDGVATHTQPGQVLMGGGADVDAAFSWQINQAGDGGDFLVLRESGTDGYNSYIWALSQRDGEASLNSVATLVLNNANAGSDSFVLDRVRNAEAIFFAGGDQSNYVKYIADTPLETLLKDKMQYITVGGTSAGMAIQGGYIYTGAHGSTVSYEALENPYNRHLRSTDLLTEPLLLPIAQLKNTIPDTHFVTRDRMGRLQTFVARFITDDNSRPVAIRSIGVDEATALLVTVDGQSKIVGDGTAYMCQPASADPDIVCEHRTPLTFVTVACERLQAQSFTDYSVPTDEFDLTTWQGTGVPYEFDISNGEIIGNPYGAGLDSGAA